MERFEYYGVLEKVVEGTGELFLKNGNKHHITFEIAKRGQEKLLFNVIIDTIDDFDAFALLKTDGLDRIEGIDNDGRKVQITGLFARDSTVGSKTDSKIYLNGYAGKCEIGEKVFSDGFVAQFELTNFLFEGNLKKVEKDGDRTKVSWPTLELTFDDFECRIVKRDDYDITKQILKRQGGVLNTSTIIASVGSQDDYDFVQEKVRKLCQLLSVARSTFISWGTCKIKDSDGNIVYELYGNTLTRPFHGNKLINDVSEDTVRFLKSAWKAYDMYEEIFDIKRFLYGYADTYMNSFIETRSLNIAVLTDNISSRWAFREGRMKFIDEEVFNKNLSKLNNGIRALLKSEVEDIKGHYLPAMLSKISGFNRRPLDWKLKRFRKAFNCPISDNEIQHFIHIRDSLAHTSLFPEDVNSTEAFLFMRHFLDRIVLSLFGYSGIYFDMENRTEKSFVSS